MNIDAINGVGPKTKGQLNKLEIYNVEDLFEHYPFRYELINISDINNIKDNDNIYIYGKIVSEVYVRRFGKLNSLSFKVLTNNKEINVTIFNRAFMKSYLKENIFVTLYGKYNKDKNNFTASNIKLGIIKNGTIVPVYHLTSGLKEASLKKIINSAFKYVNNVPSFIPEYLVDKYNFINKEQALKLIHNPSTLEDIKKAKLRLVYEELFRFMFKINYLKELNKEVKTKTRTLDKELLKDLDNNITFELTNSQKEAINDIYEDFISNKRMNRLIMGDVGSGKTIVIVYAIYMHYLLNEQSALMAPTEILAKQHYNTLKSMFKGLGLKVSLLTGSMSLKEKNEIIKRLKSGDIDCIVGTHTLIGDKVEFNNLGLVVTDEQHRFGVRQRKTFRNKGVLPDILYTTATPIPRTFALSLYGDMDISRITEKPKGRKAVNTIIKSKNEIKEILLLMLEEIKKGRQVYIISPLVEENENLDLTNVIKLKENIDNAYNSKIKTDIMHGKLKKEEKNRVMDDFVSGKTKILISTTVIEVGVDVKNATMIVIFDAEMFGLATLHQLRGRIGRNEYDSTCILVGSNNNKRLKVLEESDDGFYISEKDFEQRGEGELFGIKQSGEVNLKIANLKTDYKILLQAKKDSEEFLKQEQKNNFQNYEYYKNIASELNNLD